MAGQDPRIASLRTVPLFAHCETPALEAVAELADEVDVDSGHTLMRRGDVDSEFFLIVDGHVRIERNGAPINGLGPGDFLGEIALPAADRRTASAVTDGPARLLVVTRSDFRPALDASPDLRSAVLEAVAARIRHLEPYAVA